MDRDKTPLCWIEAHADNPGNPNSASSSPQYKKLCDKIRKIIEDERRAVEEYAELLAEIQRVVPESRRTYFFESFMAATADDEEKHIKLLERLHGIFWCKGSSSGSNPGNPDKVERYIKRRRLVHVADELTDKDAVTDALWDLRGEILKALKEIGEISPDVTGPEVQGTIDYLIRRLVFLV